MRTHSQLCGRVLIVESDEPLARLYAGLIQTHCPGIRVDCCRPDQATLIADNAGGADLAITSCGPSAATSFDSLRDLLTLRPCLCVLALIPADRPQLADAAIDSGATDVLLRAPGYLDQIAVCIRKNVALARMRTPERLRTEALRRTLHGPTEQVSTLRAELDARHANVLADSPAARVGTIHITRPHMPQHEPHVEVRPAATARAA